MAHQPVRLALLGAGIFTRDNHIPALNSLGDAFEVVAVYSRTEKSARAAAQLLPGSPDVLTDLDAVLAPDDVEAVDVILPIDLMPEVVTRALAAGKHVISEKPVAPTVAVGRAALESYAAHPNLVWMVAENWRYSTAHLDAARRIQAGEIGRPLLVSWANHIKMDPENKYYHTPWRRDNSFPGGFVLDAGVHHIAALRMLLGEVAEVRAFTAAHRSDLPPTDTLSLSMRFESGVVGTYAITFAAAIESAGQPLTIVGDKGSLTVEQNRISVHKNGGVEGIRIEDANSVAGEMAAFARAIRDGEQPVSTPGEALQDVAVLEAAFNAAASGQSLAPERIV